MESEDSKDLHESPDNKILVQIKIPSFSEKQQAANKGILSNTFPFKDEIGLYDKIITEHGRHFVVGKYSQKSPQQILFGENNVQNVEPS